MFFVFCWFFFFVALCLFLGVSLLFCLFVVVVVVVVVGAGRYLFVISAYIKGCSFLLLLGAWVGFIGMSFVCLLFFFST